MIGRLASCALCVSLAACAAPTVRPLVRASIAPGLTVEVIGLRRWSLQMIDDSLARYAPGESLVSHACIANLRDKLGFADANIIRFDTTDIRERDTTTHGTMILLVREPQDSARVVPVIRVIDDTSRQEAWRSATTAVRSDIPSFLSFYQAFLREESGRTPDGDWAAMTQLLAREHTDSGFARALRVLDNPATVAERAVAILILSRFPERDEAWRALLMAAVENHQYLDSGMAQDALRMMSARHPRTVDWSPVAPVIHNVLDGGALAALVPVIEVLPRTGVDRRSAPALLANGGEVLTALLEVSSKEVATPAHDLLVRLRGADLGADPEPWRAWIWTLR